MVLSRVVLVGIHSDTVWWHSRYKGEFCLIPNTLAGLGCGDLFERNYWDLCSEVPGGAQDCGFTSFQGNLYKCWFDLESWFLQNVFYVIKKICFSYHMSIPGFIYLRGRKPGAQESATLPGNHLDWKGKAICSISNQWTFPNVLDNRFPVWVFLNSAAAVK